MACLEIFIFSVIFFIMTFRFPFQIVRAATQTTQLFKSSILRNAIDPKRLLNTYKKINSTVLQARKISRKASYKIVHLPIKLHPSRAFCQYPPVTHNEANRRKVRKMHKCDEKEEQKEEDMKVLKFRKDCKPCRKHRPTKCPKLRRLENKYDPNEMKYNHGECADVKSEVCSTCRMDTIKGYTVKPKKLPPLPKLNDCSPCKKFKPSTAPKLVRLKPIFDPYKQNRNDSCIPDETCENGPPRMDTVLGWTVKQKSLPKIPSSDCNPCRKYKPCTAPTLIRPRKLYDDEMTKQTNYGVQECDKEYKCAGRMDDIVGFQVKQKTLPSLSKINDCVPCRKQKPKYSPKLRPLKQRYDPSKMKHSYECKTEDAVCITPRMDDIAGLKIEPKVLPKIDFDDECKLCQTQKPSSAPPLRRLQKLYDQSKLEYRHAECLQVSPTKKAPRMDDIAGFKVQLKKLPPIPASNCVPCVNYKAAKFPNLERLKKLFDDSKLVYKHQECTVQEVEKRPVRMDDLVGYKVEKRTFPKLSLINECLPCQKLRPQTAPKLVKPAKLYNDLKMKYYISPNTYIPERPKRMDDILGFKIKPKTLPPLFDNDSCEPCQKHRLCEAPELGRPEQLYDPTLLDRKDKKDTVCEDPKCAPRMDEVVGWTAKQKVLPALLDNNCIPCRKHKPTKAPKLVRLKRKYNPNDMLHSCKKETEDECELNPPRMDDVLCWKPQKKKLPSIFQKCGICTLSSKYQFSKENPTYTAYSKAQNTKRVLQNIQIQSKRYYSCKKLSSGSSKDKNTKQGKKCPQYKMPHCKPKKKEPEEQCKSRVDPPYECFNDNFKGFNQRDLTECSPYHLEILQPKNMKNNLPFILKPPPPKFSHVDPEKEIRCYEQKECADKEDEYVEPKKIFKNPCGSAFKEKRCKPRIRSHCDEHTYRHKCKKIDAPYESFSDHCPQFPPVEYTECDIADNVDVASYVHMNETMKKKNLRKTCKKTSFNYEEVNQECDYSSGGPKPGKMKKKVEKECSKTASKKKSSTGSSCKTSKKGSKTKTGEQKKGLLKSKNKPGKCSSRKASNAVTKISKEKIVSREKSTSKCDPRASKHSNEFCCNCNNEKSDRCCIPDKELLDICKRRAPQSLWQKICAYFRARPGCPAPDEWKKKRLREKAAEAAKKAGMELCPARKKGCPPSDIFYARTVESKPYKFPPVKRKRTVCKKPKGSVKASRKTTCTKSRYHSDCRSNLKLKTKKIGVLAKTLGSKITTTNNRQFSTYSTILTRSSKYNNIRKQILQNQPIFDADTKLASHANNKPTKIKLYKSSSLTDNYVGKIYKLKLTKIGIRNALITRKDTDDAHTVCYICKIVNKGNSIYPRHNANIKSLKIGANPERRTAY